jgi:hypothetical protein
MTASFMKASFRRAAVRPPGAAIEHYQAARSTLSSDGWTQGILNEHATWPARLIVRMNRATVALFDTLRRRQRLISGRCSPPPCF